MSRAAALAFLVLLLATPALATGISGAPQGSAPPLDEVPVIPILPVPASGLDILIDLGVPPGPPADLPPGPPTGLPPIGDLPPDLGLPPGPPAGLPVGPPEGLPPSFVTVAAPEPGTALLLASGLIAIAISGRRRRV
jgi:hypothetical protein